MRNDSATISGLRTVPIMLSLVLASTLSGAYMSRTGRYVNIPRIGAALLAIGTGLFGLMTADTDYGLLVLFMIVMGLGLGCIMSVSSLAACLTALTLAAVCVGRSR